MIPRITLLVASLHVALFMWLSLQVVLRRRASRVGIGTGGDAGLARAVRVHGNFAEYVPLALLMLGLLELSGERAPLLWTFGALLLAARVLHAIGLGRSAGYSAGRFWGALLSFATLSAMAATGIWRTVAAASI